MPFSNERHEGFENKIVELVARSLGASVRYVWTAPGSTPREGLIAGQCDLVAGVVINDAAVASTRAYYQAGYMFLTRRARRLALSSLDDPRLKHLAIGIHTRAYYLPAGPLMRELHGHGLHTNARSGGEGVIAADESIIEAVERGRLDAGILWGPIATHAARISPTPLEARPIPPPSTRSLFNQVAIGMATALTDARLLSRVQRALDAQRAEIDAILDSHGVPRATVGQPRIRNAQILRPPH